MKAPHIHWAKAHIDTHPVEDQQRVEFAHQANAFVGTFVVKVFTFLCFCLHSFTFALQVFTKLRETKVVEQFTAVPEDGQVFEKTKRRIFGIHTGRMTLSDDVDLEEYIMSKVSLFQNCFEDQDCYSSG